MNRTNKKSYQCAFLCVGQLGGDEVLNGGQQHNDQCTNDSAGPQQIIQQDHAHNDLNEDENVIISQCFFFTSSVIISFVTLFMKR